MVFGTLDQDDEFALQSAIADLLDQFGGSAPEEFFEFFGEFAGEDDAALGHDVVEFGEEFWDAIGGLVEDERAGNFFQALQLGSALAGFVREKTGEVELFGA
jgi:hypothetical protein